MVEYIRSFYFLFGMFVPLGVIGAVSASTLTTPEKALEIIRSQDHHFDKPHVVKVADNVYTAVGFHGATTSMIVGSDGVVMIDTLMGPKSAKNAMDALRAASGVKLPVKAIVYTHAHGDHTGGASAYIEYASDKYMVSPLIATRAAIHIGLRRRATPA